MSNPPLVTFDQTLHVRDHCLCLATQRAARRLARRFDEALRPIGLTSGQFSLMMSLNRPQPPSIGSVASLLAVDRTTLTANLKPLQRRGMIVVEADPQDRRAKLLRLTDAGRLLLKQAYPIWARTQDDVERLLQGGGSLRLRVDLDALC